MIHFKKTNAAFSHITDQDILFPLENDYINMKSLIENDQDLSNYQFAFVYDYDSFYDELMKITSYQAKMVNPKQYGDIFDNLVITKDEETIVQRFIKEACRNIRGTIDGFSKSILDNHLFRETITQYIADEYEDNLVANGGADDTTDWTDTDADGLADGFSTSGIEFTTIVTGNGFTGNAQSVSNIDGDGYLNLCQLEAGKRYRVKFKYRGTNIIVAQNILNSPIILDDNAGDAIAKELEIQPDSAGYLTIGNYNGSGEVSIDEVEVQKINNEQSLTDQIVFFIESVSNNKKKFYQVLKLADPQIEEVMIRDVIKQWYNDLGFYEGLQKEMIKYEELNSEFRASFFQMQSVRRSGIW